MSCNGMSRLLTPEQVADLLGVKKSTIYQWTHQQFIPHIKLGRNVRFDQDQVIEWTRKLSCPGRLKRIPPVLPE